MKQPAQADKISVRASLPEDFLSALEAEYICETQRLEKLHEQRIGELIVARRNEATELFLQAESEYSRAVKNAENDSRRSLRTIDNDGSHQISQIRMANLEQLVYQGVQDQRVSNEFPHIVAQLAEAAERETGGVKKICAPDPEASILREIFPDVEIRLTPENDWGGFILIGKGGTVLDSTFRTRWQALQKMASAEFSAEL